MNCEEIETTFELPNHNDKRKHLPFPDDKFLYANSMDPESVSKMNKETAIITTIKQMVPIIEFDQTGKNKSTNTNKKSLTYVQYDISVSENKAKSFGLNKLNLYSEDFTRKYHYKTSGNTKSQRKTRIATWNVFSHREYGYDFLLGHCKFLVKDVQKSNENNLQNESNILKRDWRYRFDLSPAVTEITKPVLSPIYRVPELIHQCINLDADIFCLQEADLEVLAMYRHVFEAKYSSVSHPRREKCALMTFWKTSAYEALEVKEIPLSSGRNLGSSKIMKWLSREKYFQIVGADDNFYNSSVVVLKDKFNGKVRIVVNVHALYSEPVMDGLDRAVTDSFLMRIYQVLRILKEVDDLDKKYAPESIFIMGDFNTDMSSSLPKDPMKSLIQHGHYKLPANEHNKLATTTEIYSPSPRRFKLSGQKLKVSTRNNDVEKGQIDAIFYSLSEHRSMVEITDANWLTATSMIPSLHDPSDHIPQLIDITEQTETGVLHNNVNEFIGLKK